MTTAAADKTLGKNHAGASIDQPDQAPSTLSRLLEYMVGGDQRSRLILGVVTRIVALLGLTALPFITGQAMNVISEPDGSFEQLTRWAIYGIIAGVTYLLFSFFSDRIFARMATHGLYKLQTTLFSNL